VTFILYLFVFTLSTAEIDANRVIEMTVFKIFEKLDKGISKILDNIPAPPPKKKHNGWVYTKSF
jgi:hypothetical protein